MISRSKEVEDKAWLYRELLEAYRSLVPHKPAAYGRQDPVVYPPLETDVTEADFNEAEQQLGTVIPDDLRALFYTVPPGGPAFTDTDMLSPSLIEGDRSMIKQLIGDFVNEGGYLPGQITTTWPGYPPEDPWLAFGRNIGAHHVVIEASSRDSCKLHHIDLHAFTWVPYADSIEAALRCSIELAQETDFFVAVKLQSHSSPGIRPNDKYLIGELDNFDEITSIVTKHGGNTGIFGWYDTPPEYNQPGRPKR